MTEVTSLLDVLAPQIEKVELRGKVFYVRECEYAHDVAQISNDTDGYLQLLKMSLCDAEGNLLLTNDDLPRLKKMSRAQVAKLVTAAFKVNGHVEEANAEKPDAQLSEPSTSSL